jgi:hypothetical protein
MHARCVRNATVSFLNTVAGYYRRPVDVQAVWTDRAGGRLAELLAAGCWLLAAGCWLLACAYWQLGVQRREVMANVRFLM